MLTKSQKIAYLLDSVVRYREKVTCTYCGSADCRILDRKYIFTRLFECNSCHIYFRHPVERIAQNKAFYQEEYAEIDNVTTSLPSIEELDEMKNNKFNHGNKNAERYHKIFKQLFPGQVDIKVIDYGSSWGYISWQLKKFGHSVQSFEISKPRAEYGNKNLELDIVTEEGALKGGNDIFFSSHVIEHHPSISSMLELANRLLKNDAYFIAISPNGSKAYRERDAYGFHKAWGKVHPNYLNADFYRTIFRECPLYVGSSPINFTAIRPLEQGDQVIDDLSGEELLVIAKLSQ